MAKKKNRRIDQAQPHKRQEEIQPRNFDTGNQMRDTLGIARAINARRFDADTIIKQRLESLRRQEIEDLRRNRRENQDIARKTYRRRDAGTAHVIGREVRTPEMQKQNMPSRLRYEFQDSQGTIVCQRRRTRRSIIFALQRAGRGGRRNKKARWSDQSYIVCRRVK
uniref:Uncharacterized protein n=1 Tax=Dulem virus 91 TaxID=3145802 RepID=A0AAU8B6W5_9VIRU